ncbi:hypothetical protein UZ36_04270 [Candidatus Nitromaritima sp. SCGC AAA799-C22]|nr:hypothetical protein UZ36_04270 [Candidatus Nitromaritima sp. SCGC AAA799-C22]
MKKTMSPWITLFIIFCLALPVTASQKAELNLWKFDEFMYGPCGFCGDFITFYEGKDISQFIDFSRYYQSGYYTVVLTGPAETTVTLFGAVDFATDKGFLIIIKKDDALVEIEDMEAFSPDTWVHVEARERVSGAFSAYYHPYPQFKNNIASGNWGRWWRDLSNLSKSAS